jgi:sugar lactone lactonase YvrE
VVFHRQSGNIFISDSWNNRIRKLGTDGILITYAGSGDYGYQDGPADSANFRRPRGLTIDASGVLFVSDHENHCIRKISTDRTVSTLAGMCGTDGFRDGSGNQALFSLPLGLTLDSRGHVYVAGHSDGRIRRISSAGLVSTLAGGNTMDSTDGQGTNARFNHPVDVAFNSNGFLFVADKDNHRIRVISPNGTVSTLAGSTGGYADGQGTAAQFSSPSGITVDDTGNIYVSDYHNQAIRMISPTGLVSTIVNPNRIYGSQRGQALKSSFAHPYMLDVDSNGTLYVTDFDYHKVAIICNSTCINGVMDCYTRTCKCDLGWDGANCGTRVTTTTTTTTTTSKFKSIWKLITHVLSCSYKHYYHDKNN